MHIVQSGNPTWVFDSRMDTVCFGVGDAAVTLGGENVLPLCAFDAPLANRPLVGLEIDDVAFAEGADVAILPEADFVAIRLSQLEDADEEQSLEEYLARCQRVLETCDAPLIVEGCKDPQKNLIALEALADVLVRKNALFMPVASENLETVFAEGAPTRACKVVLDAPLDTYEVGSMRDQLDQMGIPHSAVAVNLGVSAAGYGLEYALSAMEYARFEALKQGDSRLQVPVVTPVASEVWSAKEATVPEEEFPEWGPAEQRGIQMEIATAMACLASGSHAVILRHPEAVKTVSHVVRSLVEG